MPDHAAPDTIAAFITRWSHTGGAERANTQLFLSELCDLLGVPRPAGQQGGLGPYRFERSVTRPEPDGRISTRFIDLYKQGCFILEAKQGDPAPQPSLFAPEPERRATIRNTRGWAQHMLAARGQAERYARDIPAAEGNPPFLIVCDVGFCFDLYADFSGLGKHYSQFPDATGFRIYLTDLHDPAALTRLRTVWTDPHSLDPSRRRVEVTREIAAYLARLAVALEKRHSADAVATFLMRCIFCMFAQSVGLLPEACFTELLRRVEQSPAKLGLISELWRMMNTGGFSAAIETDVRRFNGGFFAPGVHGPVEPLPLEPDELRLLIAAAGRDWQNVEPAIFGTLLENALDARARGQLGAHFTPRAFVERLVTPTVMDPLRADWEGAQAAAYHLAEDAKPEAAAAAIREFHAQLCTVRVLDPACGTGNFLYVTLELMKRLEGEVLDALANLAPGEGARLALTGATVDPHQFLGLEKNPRAVLVAELVLWIGYLQWHFRTTGQPPPNDPILSDFRNIQQADSLLTYEREELVRDAAGAVVTRWDGRTTRPHPVTGEDVPDETARVELTRPVKPVATAWPAAEFIVGNPPFIAGKDLRAELGDGYAEALWRTYKKVPPSADLAMLFWWKAARLLGKGGVRRFGFITSNSLRQIFCRRVVADALAARPPARLVFAIPDHPWSDGKTDAAVRIAMTVAEPGRAGPRHPGVLALVTSERAGAADVPVVELAAIEGTINADLTVGADAGNAVPLRGNADISSRGMSLHGAGFIVTPAQARALGLGSVAGLERHICPYLNGRDLTQRSRGVMVIDLFGLSEVEVSKQYPSVWQHLRTTVYEHRTAIQDRTADSLQYAKQWWLHGKPRPELRRALRGLPRYIATVETAKHRVFCFLPAQVIPDNMLVCIASDSAFHLGVLSSRIHVAYALAAGGRLGVGNDPRYNKTRCFDPFPFPLATPAQRTAIAALAEELDALRRTRLDTHPQLTMTGLYNVLEALRAARPLTQAERDVHDAGHVSLLRDLHDRLDREVAASYGWQPNLPAAQIVERIVALNAARHAEEAEGLVHWLRPAFQAPTATARPAQQTELDVPSEAAEAALDWPRRPAEQAIALRAALAADPATALALARRFRRAPRARVEDMLQALVAMGQAHQAQDGSYYS